MTASIISPRDGHRAGLIVADEYRRTVGWVTTAGQQRDSGQHRDERPDDLVHGAPHSTGLGSVLGLHCMADPVNL